MTTTPTFDDVEKLLDQADAALKPRTRAWYVGAWEGQIDTLAQRLAEADAARGRLDRVSEFVSCRKAELTLKAEGKNAEERAARLTLTLQEDEQYQQSLTIQREVEQQIRVADSLASVARNRIRLYQEVCEGWDYRRD